MLFLEKNGKILVIFGNIIFFSEKERLEGTSEIFEKNKVKREKWPVPSNGLLV